jgi:alpha-1,2-mannosyltransferase
MTYVPDQRSRPTALASTTSASTLELRPLDWRRRLAEIAWVGALTLAIALALTLLQRATDHRGMIDLGVYRKGAWAFVHGRSPFANGLPGPRLPFTYTPFSTLVFAPLAYLSLSTAMVVHTFVSLFALSIGCFLVIDQLVDADATHRQVAALVAVAGAIVFASEPVLQTLGFGQINLVLMAMILLDLLALRSSRWGGVLLGIAAGIKLTPFVFIAYLVAVRRYRTATVATISAAATVAVGWIAMPGPSDAYFSRLMWDPRRVGNVNYVANQSLNGMWTRLLHSDTAAKPYWAVSALVVLAVGLWLASKVHERLGEPSGLAVATIVGLLVSPISWSHHWVWWMVPSFLLVAAAWRARSLRLAGVALLWSIPFYVAPFWFVPHVNHRTYPAGVLQQMASSAYVLVGLAGLAATGVWLLRDAARTSTRTDLRPAST